VGKFAASRILNEPAQACAGEKARGGPTQRKNTCWGGRHTLNKYVILMRVKVNFWDSGAGRGRKKKPDKTSFGPSRGRDSIGDLRIVKEEDRGEKKKKGFKKKPNAGGKEGGVERSEWTSNSRNPIFIRLGGSGKVHAAGIWERHAKQGIVHFALS